MGILISGVALAALTLSGCAPGSSTSNTGSYNAEEVTVWYLNDAEAIVQQAIDRFEADTPGVTVVATAFSNDDYKVKRQVGLGTEAAPDVFTSEGGALLAEFVNADQIIPLDDLAESAGFVNSIGAGALDSRKIDGTLWAIPVLSDASFVWYSKTIFDEVGVEVPATWEDLIDVIGTLRAAGYDPIAMANKTQWPGSHWWSEIVTLACGPAFLAGVTAGDPAFDFNDPCIVEAGERIQELVDAAAFNEGFNGLDYDSGESRQLFWNGTAAMNHMGNWLVAAAIAEAPEFVDQMDFFTLPAWNGAKGTSDMVTGGIGMSWSVAKKDGDSANAQKLVQYLSDEKTGQTAADNGRIPVIAGPTLSDPLLQKVSETVNVASAFQEWPNVVLNPTLTTVMLEQVQALFGKDTTPEAAAAAMQAAYVESSN